MVGGYWSHLWIDMLNIRGVDLFWPSPVRLVTPGNRNWRLQVGSKGEMILLSGLLVAGEPLRVVAERVDLRGHTLRWLVSRIDQSRPYYLLGEVEMPDGGRRWPGDSIAWTPITRPATGAASCACTTPALRNWGRGWIGWPSGARWWCSSGSGPARRR